jgi:hypothetical protein
VRIRSPSAHDAALFGWDDRQTVDARAFHLELRARPKADSGTTSIRPGAFGSRALTPDGWAIVEPSCLSGHETESPRRHPGVALGIYSQCRKGLRPSEAPG